MRIKSASPSFGDRVRGVLYAMLMVVVVLSLLLGVGALGVWAEGLGTPFHVVWGTFLSGVVVALLIAASPRFFRALANWQPPDTYLMEARDGSAVFGVTLAASILVGSVLYAVFGGIGWVIGAIWFGLGVVLISMLVATRHVKWKYSIINAALHSDAFRHGNVRRGQDDAQNGPSTQEPR